MRRLSSLLALLMALTLMPTVAQPQTPAAAAAQAEPPALSQTTLPGYNEARDQTALRNDLIGNAEPIGNNTIFSWTQTISGTIDSSADLDYFLFEVTRPASAITITLSGPQADYDLVLGGGQDSSQTTIFGDEFEPGLEDITQIGGSIKSIGGSIKSIGGSIKSIGGSIKSISANAGTASESISTQLWLPGEYVVVVTTANGEFSPAPYTLAVTLSDSGLTRPAPAPEVEFRLPPSTAPAAQITTLYIYNSARMARVYGLAPFDPDLFSIQTSVGRLSNTTVEVVLGAPVEKGLVVDLAELRALDSTLVMTDVYSLWDSNKANPFYANYVAGVIDNIIEAATTDGISGAGAQGDYFMGPSRTLGLTVLPNLRNVVLIGGDEVIPFYRLPDLTEIANEADYAAYLRSIDRSGIIESNSALGAAMRYSMLLSDSVYGADRPFSFYGFPFYVPQLAVGRIVETPAEIADFLEFYSNGSAADFQIDITAFGQPGGPRRAFIGGYDFLEDQSKAIEAILRARGLQPAELNLLINNSWGRPELEQQWFDGVLATEFPAPPATIPFGSAANIDLGSVNAHFDHWQLLPANNPTGAAGATFPATRLLEPQYSEPPLYFSGTLGYSVGCHSGYSVTNGAISPLLARNDIPRYQADFAQAFNRHGGNWVGNTGYGYGTADGIDYSERLAVLYTQELVRAVLPGIGGATIGEALVNARQRYVRNSASLTAYDYKALSIKTLYGLPFVRVQVSNPLAPPPEDPAPNRTAPHEIPPPIPPDPVSGRLTRTLTFTIDIDEDDFQAVERTGSTLYDLEPQDFTVVDEFNQRGGFPLQPVRIFSNNQVGVPSLPTFAYDISVQSSISSTERLKVLDVVFLRGTYANRAAFNPQVTQVATETLTTTPIVSRTDEPSFEAGAGIWYPDKFFGFSSFGAGKQQRDQLTAFAAQFRGDANGATGLLRPYSEMVFRITYDDPGVNPTNRTLDDDNQPPTITSVRIQAVPPVNSLAQPGAAQAGSTRIVVQATDTGPDVDGEGRNQGIAEVSTIYVRDGRFWEPVTLRETSAGSGVFIGDVPLKPGAARFIVRATDVAGNSSYYTAKGRFTPLTTIHLPFVRR